MKTSTYITQYELDNILRGLSVLLVEKDPSISIIRFGSSLLNIEKESLDIDLLLLSERIYYNVEFADLICQLRSNLLEGLSDCGIELVNAELNESISNYLKSQTIYSSSSIIPKFIFGPLNSSVLLKGIQNIILHFKGPLKEDDFAIFCKELPFHGYAILKYHNIIYGSFSVDQFVKHIELDKVKFMLFNNGLKKRVEKSNSIDEIKKCTQKLVLNLNLFIKYNEYPDIQFSPIIIKEENLSVLKHQFFTIYNEILKLR